MRKGPSSPFGYSLMGIGWLIGRLIPGRIGQIIGGIAILLITSCMFVLLNHPKLSRSWPDIFSPVS